MSDAPCGHYACWVDDCPCQAEGDDCPDVLDDGPSAASCPCVCHYRGAD